MNPFVEVTVIMDDPLPPWARVTATGFPLIVKSAVTTMLNVKGCEWMRLPLVPVIVIVEVEAGVPGSTLTVASDVAVPPGGGVTLADENETCTPESRAPALNATAELNEPIEVIVTVSVAELPAPTLSVGELSDNEKSELEITVSAKAVV